MTTNLPIVCDHFYKEKPLLVMVVTAVVKMVTVERCKEIVTEILIVNQVIRYKLKTILLSAF